jgi:hypothetical protein
MKTSATEPVQFDRETLAALARDLDVLVVSLDRIGSTYHDDPAGFERALADFVTEWQVTQRLARARRVVDDALLGPGGSPSPEDELGPGDAWEPKP